MTVVKKNKVNNISHKVNNIFLLIMMLIFLSCIFNRLRINRDFMGQYPIKRILTHKLSVDDLEN